MPPKKRLGETTEEFLCRIDPEFRQIVEKNQPIHEERDREMRLNRRLKERYDRPTPSRMTMGSADADCRKCRGTGQRECGACDGQGWYMGRDGDRQSCLSCRGTGTVTCSCTF